MHTTHDRQPRAFLVAAEVSGHRGELGIESSLAELALLADTAGIEVVGQAVQRLSQPDPATFIGSGKVQEVAAWVKELGADIVLFDDELSPRHQRELEKVFGESVRVIDRTELILDIFAQHARTREGALQVTLAQYEYRLPRLTRQWTHLARQAGGGVARGGAGGVGLRGPGETQLETDRRDIRRRITFLKAQIEDIRAHRERHRAQRRRSGIPVVALVGYTNAGKSTMLNRLADADVYVADQLFATLDPTTRRVTLPSGRAVLFADTVGFIQKLPHSLVAAFRATLEEIGEASLLLHIVDASHPDAEQQIRVVERTLKDELGLSHIPVITVLNKADAVEQGEAERLDALLKTRPQSLATSARLGTGIDRLLSAVEETLQTHELRVVIRVPHTNGAVVARFYEAAVVDSQQALEDYVELSGRIPRRDLDEFKPYLVRGRKRG
jgi:GTP-binding protein HflX